jgi:hypothetical protein
MIHQMRGQTVLGALLAVVVSAACTSTPSADVSLQPQPSDRLPAVRDGLSASRSSTTSEGLTLHIDKPPSRGVDGGTEVILLVEQQVCPDTKAGSRFGFSTTARSETSWTADVRCTDGSRHTVVIVWDTALPTPTSQG